MPVRDQVYVEVLADTRKAGKSFVEFAAKAATVYASVRAVGKVLGDLTEAASRANEVNSKFNVTFSEISDRAEAVAKNLQEAYGLSVRESEQLLSSTGDLLTGFGFTQDAALQMADSVNTLAVDLASFQNLSGGAEQASQALTKALLGERESIKSLGIAITEADIKRLAEQKGITGELDRQTKAMLTLELATKQSKNAIGDFERTQDSVANQSRQLTSNMEDLKVTLGKNLTPTVATLTKLMNEGLSKGIENLNAMTELRGFQEPINEQATALQKLQNAYAQFGQRVRGVVEIDRTRLSVAENIQATEAEILNLQRAYANTRLVQEAAKRLGIETKVAKRLEDRKKLLETLKARQDTINEAVDTEAQLHDLINEKLAFRGQIDVKPEKTENQIEAEERLAEAFAKTDEAQIQAIKSQIAYFETFKQGPEALAVLRMFREELAGLTGEAKSSLDVIREQHDAYVNLYGNINALSSQTHTALDETKEKTEDIGEAALSSMEKFHMLAAAGQNLFSSLTSLSNAYYEAEIQNAEGNDQKIKELKREQAIVNKGLAIFNATINTAEAVSKALTAAPPPFNFALAALSGAAGIAQIAAIAAQPIPALAEGGIVNSPTLALIGEAGPEAVVPLGKGTGGNVTIIVQGSMVRERDVARMITAGQQRLMGAY